MKATLTVDTVQPPCGTHWAPDPWTLGPIGLAREGGWLVPAAPQLALVLLLVGPGIR